MSKKIVISFPGIRGTEIPLLYFGSKVYEDQGYEKVFIGHPQAKVDDGEALYEAAKKKIGSLDLGEYEEIVFIAKSMGTVIACRLKEELGIPATLVLYTPLEETLPYIRKDNEILLVAAGDRDRYLDTGVLQDACKKEGIPYYIEADVGHRMEVKNNLKRSLEVVANVVGRLLIS